LGHYESEILTKGGERRIVAWSNTMFQYSAKGNIVGSTSLGKDITDRKETEEALRVSEEKFSKAFHSIPDSMSISSVEDGRILEINEGFEKISGYCRDEALGKTTLELNLWQNGEDRDAVLREHGDKTRVVD
jgi:PAS domain-containing protein